MSKPKVLIFEPIHQRGVDFLRQENCEVVFPDSLDEEALLRVVPDISGIIVRTRGRVSRRLLEGAPRLKVVGRHGVGLETIDVEAATQLGVWVVNTPKANAESVAEHFLTLALMLSKKIPQTTKALSGGNWNARNEHVGREIFGKTLGVVGFGRIGQTIGRMCQRAFETRVLYFNNSRKEACEKEFGARQVSLEELLKEADYVSINLPLTPQTQEIIGAEQLALMKPSAYIINTSHGRIWREADLLAALQSGRIGGAASDVYAEEPATPDHPLLKLHNFLGTPHNAAQTEEALQRMAMVAEDIVAVLHGRPAAHAVNQPRRAEI